MASFMASLWESIFTPGPTPTLLIATNATFGALQLLLLTLLLVTHSIHFIVLSTLCAGLWGAINWFARELAAAKAEGPTQDQNKRQTSPDQTGSDTETETEHGTTTGAVSTAAEPSPGSGGGGVEGAVARRRPPPPPPQPGAAAMPPPTSKPVPRPVPVTAAVTSSLPQGSPLRQQQQSSQEASSSQGSQGSSQGGVPLPSLSPSHKTRDSSERKYAAGDRRRSLGDSSGYVSTDSEWEKVSEGEGQ